MQQQLLKTRKPTAALSNSFATENTSETKSNLFLLEGKRCRTRCRTVLTKFMVVVLFVFPFTSCESSERPVEEYERLPFGVFPLNDVKWVETNHFSDPWSAEVLDGIFNSYRLFYDTITYSVRQVGENKAELHRSYQTRRQTFVNSVGLIEDSIWTNKDMRSWIIIEGKKVYLQHLDEDGIPILEEWGKELFYDFSLEVGDIFQTNYWSDWTKYRLNSIERVMVGSEYRNQYNFIHLVEGESSQNNFSTIEGIGCTKNFSDFRISANTDPMQHFNLIEVYHKNKLIWRKQ